MEVYLDNAATTKVDPDVEKAMQPYFCEKYGNASSLHDWGREAKEAVDEARETIANFLNAGKPTEIIFTGCATESNNLALKGTVEKVAKDCSQFKGGNKPHLIISSIEHHSVLDTAKYLKEAGKAEISWLDVDQVGKVDPKEIDNLIKEETVLVSVMYVNNEIGTIEPLEEIGNVIRKHKKEREGKTNSPPLYFHTDAVQGIEYLETDVQELNLDLLSLAGHKIHAPKGVGALYVREGTKVATQIHGGGQEYGLRAGTENIPYIVGLGKAIKLLEDYQNSDIGEKVTRLRDMLIENILADVPQAQLTGPEKDRVSHIASFVFPNAEGEALLLHLNRAGIAASSGSACTSGTLETSHVLEAIGIAQDLAHTSLRLSLSRSTSGKEIDYVIEKLPEITKEIRNMAPSV